MKSVNRVLLGTKVFSYWWSLSESKPCSWGSVRIWRQRHRLFLYRQHKVWNGLHGYQCYCSHMATAKLQKKTASFSPSAKGPYCKNIHLFINDGCKKIFLDCTNKEEIFMPRNEEVQTVVPWTATSSSSPMTLIHLPLTSHTVTTPFRNCCFILMPSAPPRVLMLYSW